MKVLTGIGKVSKVVLIGLGIIIVMLLLYEFLLFASSGFDSDYFELDRCVDRGWAGWDSNKGMCHGNIGDKGSPDYYDNGRTNP